MAPVTALSRAAVGRDADLQLAVACGDHVGQRSTHRSIGIQHQNAFVIIAEFEFAIRTDHSARGGAANLGTLENGPIG